MPKTIDKHTLDIISTIHARFLTNCQTTVFHDGREQKQFVRLLGYAVETFKAEQLRILTDQLEDIVDARLETNRLLEKLIEKIDNK